MTQKKEDKEKITVILIIFLSISALLANIVATIQADLWMQLTSSFALVLAFVYSLYLYKWKWRKNK